MPRRPHKKSRGGCTQCKQRHIKCDETQPRCVNCTTIAKACSFEHNALLKPSLHHSHESKRSLPTTPGPPTPFSRPDSRSNGTTLPPMPSFSTPVSDPILNLEHLELFHNYLLRTYASFSELPAQQRIWNTVMIEKHAFRFPFLMHQILALSALHLTHLCPAQSPHYHALATQLQNSAMNGFNAMQKSIDESSCIAVLLFSSLLALHVLADSTSSQASDFGGWVDHFTSCMRLSRSVYSLVVSDYWPYLHAQEDMAPLFHVPDPQKPFDVPVQLTRLEEIARNPSLPESAQKAYAHAIERLMWLFARSGVPNKSYSTVQWILGWMVQLTEEYLKLLHERRPEALVILAYFGMLLSFYKHSWVVGDKGEKLLKEVSGHLGAAWGEWLAWPLEVVERREIVLEAGPDVMLSSFAMQM